MRINLTFEEAIVVKNALMVLLQNTKPDSRIEIRKMLEAITEKIRVEAEYRARTK